ncbi:MAG TPA: cupin domain-containing protein [Bryobacteraceae bacterium]|nr:cupin domain-containing protein [Bryobacteraceae bacterium]
MNTAKTSETQPLIVRTQEVVGFSQGLGEARILIDGAKSQNEWWLGHFEELPGFMTTLHFHHDMDESVYVLDGILSIFVGGQWKDLSPGTFALLPKGIPHAQGNTSSSPVRFLGSGKPAGFERLFPELDQLAKRVPADSPEFGKEAARLLSQHATTIIGPPPRRH